MGVEIAHCSVQFGFELEFTYLRVLLVESVTIIRHLFAHCRCGGVLPMSPTNHTHFTKLFTHLLHPTHYLPL